MQTIKSEPPTDVLIKIGRYHLCDENLSILLTYKLFNAHSERKAQRMQRATQDSWNETRERVSGKKQRNPDIVLTATPSV